MPPLPPGPAPDEPSFPPRRPFAPAADDRALLWGTPPRDGVVAPGPDVPEPVVPHPEEDPL
jgi:hypothetical protein